MSWLGMLVNLDLYSKHDKGTTDRFFETDTELQATYQTLCERCSEESIGLYRALDLYGEHSPQYLEQLDKTEHYRTKLDEFVKRYDIKY